jgi:hypothetical protein
LKLCEGARIDRPPLYGSDGELRPYRLGLGFDAGNAQAIFKMTAAS